MRTNELTTLAVAVNLLCQAVALNGASEEAARLISEAEAIADATGSPVVPAGALVLAALKGREPNASNLIDVTIERATAGGQGIAVQFALWARSVVLNGLGRYREALAAARDASDDGPELFISYVSAWALIELIEAATRCEDLDLAGSALDRLTERTRASDSDWGLGVEAPGSGATERLSRPTPSPGPPRSGPGAACRTVASRVERVV